MLQKIRDISHGWFTWTILGAVCIAFAFWGIQNYFSTGPQGEVVAKVNGIKITESTVLNATRQLQQQQKAWLEAGLVTQEQLRSVALDQLIKNEVIRQALVKQGFAVSLAQIKQYLQTMPEFQVNGHYSAKQYKQIIGRLPFSESEFLNQIRDTLMLQQLQAGLSDSAFALPNEVQSTKKILSQIRHIGYAIVKKDHFIHLPTFTTEQIKEYYDKHLPQFDSPEQGQFEYIELNADELWQKLPDTAKQATNKELVFAEKSEELAKLSYEDPNSLEKVASELGLKLQTTPYVTRQGTSSGITANANVLKAAFNDEVLQQGYNSDVISVDSNHSVVIRVKNYKPSTILPLDSVTEKVQQALLAEWQQHQMQQVGDILVKQIQTGNDPTKVVQQFGLTWETKQISTTDSSANSAISSVVFMQAAPLDKAHPSVTSALLPDGNRVVIAVVEITYPADIPSQLNDEMIKQEIISQNKQLAYYLYQQSQLENARIRKM